MTKEEIKNIIKDNIDDIYNDIHKIIEYHHRTRHFLNIKKEINEICIRLEYYTHYDSKDDYTYLIDVFCINVRIYYKDSIFKQFCIDTHHYHSGNYMKRSKEEILLDILDRCDIGD